MKTVHILLSPINFLIWIKRKRTLYKYKKHNLKIGYRVSITNTNFGINNHLGDNVAIINSTIDDHSYVNTGSKIINARIGKFCSISDDVRVGLGEHPTNFVSTHGAFYSKNKQFKTFADKEYFFERKEITIGNDVWIGSNSIILNSVKIGDGAIIAAGAVVTKNVEPYTIVGGIPAKPIKKRFSDEIITKLLEIKWWNFENEFFKENFSIFHDVNTFVKKFS